MKWILIFLLAVASLHASAVDRRAPDSSPNFHPAASESLDRLFNEGVAEGEIPGVVFLLIHQGKVQYFKSFGWADIEEEIPLETDAIFRIASMTKAVTSVGIMMLYERGHFLLNDPVSKFLPELRAPRVLKEIREDGSIVTERAAREISIRDLLTHTSGIPYPFIKTPLQNIYRESGIVDGLTTEPVVLADNIRKLGDLPLLHHPGERWTYGLNTDVLGRLIEVVSGKPLNEFLRTEIFEPLEMKDTHFYLPTEKAHRLVALYTKTPDGTLLRQDRILEFNTDANYPIAGSRTYFSGGAGLSSTASDYGRFVLMLLNEGALDGHKILSRKSVELMRRPAFDGYGGPGRSYGLGFSVVTDVGLTGELDSDGAYSGGGAFHTKYWIDPKEDLIGVFMTQVRPARTTIAERARVLAYQGLD